MKKSRVFTLIITTILIFSMTACNFNIPQFNNNFKQKYPEYGNYPVNAPHYSDRVYVEPNKQEVEKLIADLTSLINDDSASLNDILIARYALLNVYYEIMNSAQIAEFTFYRDYANEDLQNRFKNVSNYYNYVQNKVFEIEKLIFSSKHQEKMIESYGQAYYESIMNYNVKNQDVLELEEQIVSLTAEYDSTEIKPENSEILANIFIDLVNMRNQLARKTLKPDGVTYYDNYVDYAYAEVYYRPYTPDEIQKFRSYVLEYYVPLSSYIYDNFNPNYNYSKYVTSNTIKEYMPVIIENSIPQMINSWDYMMAKGLYDFDNLENKITSSFVSEMPGFGDGFMFIGTPNNLTTTINTVIHEFGHYNAIFATDENKAGSVNNSQDLAETHSQAFEFITLPAVTNLLKEKHGSHYQNSYVYNLILNSIWTPLFNSAVDEFEYIVYNSDSNLLNEDFIANTFTSCLNKYWIHNSSYQFYDIMHLYSVPSYCISYAVSSVFSAEIWANENSVEKYIEVVSYGDSNTITHVCQQTQLPSPLEKQTVKNATDKYYSYLNEFFGWA